MAAGPRVGVGGPEEEGDAQPWVWKPDQGQLHPGDPHGRSPWELEDSQPRTISREPGNSPSGAQVRRTRLGTPALHFGEVLSHTRASVSLYVRWSCSQCPAWLNAQGGFPLSSLSPQQLPNSATAAAEFPTVSESRGGDRATRDYQGPQEALRPGFLWAGQLCGHQHTLDRLPQTHTALWCESVKGVRSLGRGD